MLYNIDCMELLTTLEDDSVDLVLTDPPYALDYDRGKGWDSQWTSQAEYLEWCQEWTRECVRVLKPNRMMVVFGTLKTDTFLHYKLQTSKLGGLHSNEEIIWSYNWGGRSKKNFARKHEFAWCWSKGKEFLFNAEDVRVPRKTTYNNRNYKRDTTIPTCVWEKNNHTVSKEYCNWHPTQKPFMILERIIKAYTNPGDIVLDCFSGSASTAISCDITNRRFIGSELDTEYYEKSIIRRTSNGESTV